MSASTTWDPDATREAIIEAAGELFIEHGFSGVSLSQIARKAKVTKSLIHHHFGAKRELWEAIVGDHMSEYVAAQHKILDEIEAGTGLASIERSLRLYYSFLRRNPAKARMLTWMSVERAETPPEICELTERSIQIMRRAQQTGEFRDDVDARFIMQTFLAMVQHWFQHRDLIAQRPSHAVLDNEGEDDAYIEAVIKLLIDGIRGR